MTRENEMLDTLINTIRRLRSSDGCPWDRKQTDISLLKYLEEEVEELIEGIRNNDPANICEEIGDIIYVLIMLVEIHEEKNNFTFHEVLTHINQKLVRRHPHVFDGKTIGSEEELRIQWNSIKQQEKKKK